MKLPTFNHTRLARLFLMGLGLAGLGSAWSGIGPETLTSFPCLFSLVANIPCPGCGMTRACLALVQGNPALAWSYHPLSLALVPLAGAVACVPVAWDRLWRRRVALERIAAIATAITLGVWVYRLFF
jgi:hypothetical protein